MKTSGTRRVLVPRNWQSNKAIAMAVKLGIEFSRKVADEIEGVVLYLSDKKSIRNSSLEKVVSPKIAILLHKGEQVPMGKGLGLRAETVRTYKDGSHRDIVIAIDADSKMMEKIDGMAGLHTVIAVPRKDGDLDSWAETWSPIIPGAKKKVAERVVIDPVVADALSALAVGIDLSKPGMTMQDRKQVENMVRLLKQNRHQEEPAKVHAWAVQKGWHSKTADELVAIWEEVYRLGKTSKSKDAAPVIKPEGGNIPLVLSLPKGGLLPKGASRTLRLTKRSRLQGVGRRVLIAS